eukprot:scaffold16107_cov67-Phaeocystis_antarctica.AAC.5
MLRTVQNVVRLGRVMAVRATSLELEKGAMPLAPGTLLVDCAGVGAVPRSDYDVFAPAHIKLSTMLSLFNVSYSAALIAHVEATFADDATKNGFMPHSAAVPLMQGGSLCYKGQLGQFVQWLLGDIRTKLLFAAHTPSAAFHLTTRTNYNAPCHSSLLKTLHSAYGPDLVKKRGGKLMTRSSTAALLSRRP